MATNYELLRIHLVQFTHTTVSIISRTTTYQGNYCIRNHVCRVQCRAMAAILGYPCLCRPEDLLPLYHPETVAMYRCLCRDLILLSHQFHPHWQSLRFQMNSTTVKSDCVDRWPMYFVRFLDRFDWSFRCSRPSRLPATIDGCHCGHCCVPLVVTSTLMILCYRCYQIRTADDDWIGYRDLVDGTVVVANVIFSDLTVDGGWFRRNPIAIVVRQYYSLRQNWISACTHSLHTLTPIVSHSTTHRPPIFWIYFFTCNAKENVHFSTFCECFSYLLSLSTPQLFHLTSLFHKLTTFAI